MKTIDIHIENKIDLVEIYDKESVSSKLINYILNKTMYITNTENLELNLYVTKETKGCTSIIMKGLEEEYKNSLKKCNIINMKQVILLLIGLLILLISTLISNSNILHEVIIIIGWVPIWEAVELELLTDTKEKRKRKLLNKLINSNIKEIVEK